MKVPDKLDDKEQKKFVEDKIISEFCVNQMVNDENVIRAIDYFKTPPPNEEYGIVLEMCERTL